MGLFRFSGKLMFFSPCTGLSRCIILRRLLCGRRTATSPSATSMNIRYLHVAYQTTLRALHRPRLSRRCIYSPYSKIPRERTVVPTPSRKTLHSDYLQTTFQESPRHENSIFHITTFFFTNSYEPELAHHLQTSKMRRNSTSLNSCQHDVINIVTVNVARRR